MTTSERIADQYHTPSPEVATVVAAILLGELETSEANTVGPVVHWVTTEQEQVNLKGRVKAITNVIKNRERVSA